MNLLFLHPQAKKLRDNRNELKLVTVYQPVNTSEGSEFLDDALRMNEQPLTYIEECDDTGCRTEAW